MKKYLVLLLPVLLLTLPSNAYATPENTVPVTAPIVPLATKKTSVESMELRLTEIEAIDKKGLNRREKSDLRQESKSLKKDIAQHNGGVYLSATSLIILLLVIIILF